MDRYDSSFKPPAPVLDVLVSNPNIPSVRAIEDKGLIDSGASRTVIPDEWVSRLRLLPVRKRPARGYKDEKKEQEHYSYIVNIAFKQYSFDVEAIAVKRKNVLIGRDVLNKLSLLLDGKNLNFEVTDP